MSEPDSRLWPEGLSDISVYTVLPPRGEAAAAPKLRPAGREAARPGPATRAVRPGPRRGRPAG